ncbi:hypothetical protein N0V93_002773 [Gnomoniopsis smithogilvyi]|uniref:CFEM domain-containing protein n=1 Tax=Gnomoniopsis smithogilvyi TaxID=1191159 RepID=A0A9W8YX78_9PEZI|nr:hypothetical protein N0V93_002773 [Gnomoniopsis smithogilvyi]
MADLAGVPQCGLACLISSLSATTCAATNTTCLCLDKGFESVVSICVLSNCTIREVLAVKNGTSLHCGLPEANEVYTFTVITGVIISLQTVFFVLRMLCRAVRIAPWGWDDTTIVVAFIFTTSFAAASGIESHYGMGRNVWTVPPDDIDQFLKVFFAFEAIYAFVLGVIKISICFLYLRIFPGHRFRVVVWATQVFNIALVFAFIVADVLQCRPLSYFWQGWDGEHEGYCLNLTAFVYSHAALNIALDVWMLALPASQIWQLNMNMKKKVGVIAMFGFGVLLTLVSIIRLLSLKGFATTQNPTMAFYRVGVWTAVEITAGLMVACMPAARLFVMYCVSHLFSTTRSRLASEPYPARSSKSNGSGGPPAARTLSGKLANNFRHKSLTPKDLDRNRDYSMSVTVTSDRKNFLSSESDDLKLAETEGTGVHLEDLRGSTKSSPSREQFGLSDRPSMAGESHGEKPRRILVTQDVSVSNESSLSRRQELQDEFFKKEYWDV